MTGNINLQQLKQKYQRVEVVEYANQVSKKPLVSVCVQTYQHNLYIEECLEGILMQKVDFPFEILLGEDNSTDGTREICLEYAKKHPDRIRLFLHHRDNNIKVNGRPTGRFNFLHNLFSAKGNYIALCPGDDYWTDPLKLQKQVDFLERCKEFGIVFNKVKEVNQFTGAARFLPEIDIDTVYTIDDYILNNKTATGSMMWRKDMFLPNLYFFTKLPFGDLGITLNVMNNSNRKCMVFKDIMGVYRIHEGGIHGSFHKSASSLIRAYKQHNLFIDIIKKDIFSNRQCRKSILKKKHLTYKKLSELYRENHDTLNYLLTKAKSKYYNLLSDR